MTDRPDFFADPVHQPFTLRGGSTGALLLHGFAGTPAEMRPLAEHLNRAEQFSATGVLLPGFGPDIANLGEIRHTDWLKAARTAWQAMRDHYETTVLAGYSMGGAVAIMLAAEAAPDALVLVAPFSRMDSWLFRSLPLLKYVVPAWRPFRDANFDDPAVQSQLAAMMPGLDIDDPATRDFLRNDVSLPLSALDELRRVGDAAYKAAAAVTAPTLVIQGSNDETVSPASSRALASRLGGPVVYEELDAGHEVVRQPGRFAPHLASFLQLHLREAVR